jgi:RTA1 like protein
MIAGLSFQVFTLLIFIILCIDFAVRTRQRFNSMGVSAFDQNPKLATLRASAKFKGFLAALTLATICVFWRSVYRVVELAEGWTGDLIRHQNLFIAFEGVMVIVACLALNAFHPAICFREGVEGLGGLGSKRKAKESEKGTSGSNSDVEMMAT